MHRPRFLTENLYKFMMMFRLLLYLSTFFINRSDRIKRRDVKIFFFNFFLLKKLTFFSWCDSL